MKSKSTKLNINASISKLSFQVNSIFHMKRPYDLVAFLQQERRVEQLEHLKEVLADTSSLDTVVDKHEPDLESR